jgi:KaiC/GvpD/RAD55 family RecA-like ATPase
MSQVSALLTANTPDKVEKIRGVIQGHLMQARYETSSTLDVDVIGDRDKVIARLRDRRDNPGHLRGLSTGFDGIDHVTGGLQPEQFIVLIGIPKSGKSSFLLYMMWAIHQVFKRPLFIGFEMSNEEQQDRWFSMLSGVSLTKILTGMTDDDEQRLIERRLHMRGKKHPPLIFSADISSAMTVSGIQAKVQEHRPDALFIDGAYLMDSDNPRLERGTEGSLRDISRSLKRLAQTARIPIVVTTQALLSRSKGGLTMSSVGYTSAWAQDCDVMLGVERQPDSNISKFHVIASRSGPRKDTYVEWDWDQGLIKEIDEMQFTATAKMSARKDVFDDDDD